MYVCMYVCVSVSVCIYVCMFVRMSFLYFDPGVFVSVRWSTPSQFHRTESSGLSIITCIILKTELFTVLNSFAGAVKTS